VVSPVVVASAVVESGLSVVFGASPFVVDAASPLVNASNLILSAASEIIADPPDFDFTASAIFDTAASMAFETASGCEEDKEEEREDPLPLELSPLPVLAPLLSDHWLLLTPGGCCASGHCCAPASALSPLPLLAPGADCPIVTCDCEPLAAGPLGSIELEPGVPDEGDTSLETLWPIVTDDALPDFEAASDAPATASDELPDHELPGDEGP